MPATVWIVVEMWGEKKLEHAFNTKQGAENWVRITMQGDELPDTINIYNR